MSLRTTSAQGGATLTIVSWASRRGCEAIASRRFLCRRSCFDVRRRDLDMVVISGKGPYFAAFRVWRLSTEAFFDSLASRHAALVTSSSIPI